MADDGAGATLSFTTGTILDITAVQSGGISYESLDTTHHGTAGGAKTFMRADFRDPGTLTVSWLYDPNVQPPETSQTITLTYPVPAGNSSGATEAFTGFLTDFDAPDLQIDEVMIATATFKKSGILTYSSSTG